jgi:hypothetical protein
MEEVSGAARFLCTTDPVLFKEAINSINHLVRGKGWFLRELSFKEPSLEEIFLGLFKKEP